MDSVPDNDLPNPTGPYDPKGRSWLEELGKLIGRYLADCDLKKAAAQPTNTGSVIDLPVNSEK
jgi:hypothetical protein